MVSFEHGVVTVFNTCKAASLVGEGCAVNGLFRAWSCYCF